MESLIDTLSTYAQHTRDEARRLAKWAAEKGEDVEAYEWQAQADKLVEVAIDLECLIARVRGE